MFKKRNFMVVVTTILAAAFILGTVFSAVQSPTVYAQTTPITFDNMTLLSPDGQSVVYVTANDLGMAGSKIWIANADGTQSTQLVAGDTGDAYWVTNPIWSPDSQQIAYVKAVKLNNPDLVTYRYEIWAIQSNGSNNRLLTDTLFTPLLGYGGQTDLVWNATNEVEFPGGTRTYAVNTTTLAISDITGAQIFSLPNSASISSVPAYSQHTLSWASNTINPGYNCPYTIGDSGSAITAAAMTLDYLIPNTTIQPDDVNSAMAGDGFAYDGFGYKCLIRWAILASKYPAIEVDDSRVYPPSNDPLKFDEIRRKIAGGVPPIVWYYTGPNSMNFLVMTAYNGNTFTAITPSSGNTISDDFSNYDFKGAIFIQQDATFSKIAPQNNTTNVNPVNLTINWDTIIPDPDVYRYCLYIEGHPADCASNSTNWTSAQLNTQKTLSTLLGNTTYYWQVQAKTGSNKINANGGVFWKFTTGTAPNTPTPSKTPTSTTIPTPTSTPTPVTSTTIFTSIGADDGWILESGENSDVGGTMNDDGGNIRVGDEASKKQYRSILSFDTSSLPNNATIDMVQIKVKESEIVGKNPFTVLGDLRVDIRYGKYGTRSLELSDFDEVGSAGQVGFFDPAPNSNGWYTVTLTKGLNYINVAGLTQFRLRFTIDDNDDAVADCIKFYSGDSTTDQPKLIITYTTP